MEIRKYGDWDQDDFHQAIVGLSPAGDTDEYDVESFREDLMRRGHIEAFMEAFAEFLLDDAATFAEKGDLYLGGMDFSGQAWDYFKWLWENLAPGKPWPLKDRPRPEDEPNE